MKFSGGRSSGMLLFTLLENGLLSAERGDVVVFNNTSCEHPETYRFAARCKEIVERRYGVPFFWVEFQTYEDARRGEWTRIQSYRLVNSSVASEANPHGFHWRGEVFEELLSHAAYVPNQFRRVCTSTLKLEATRLFLKDWFACKESIPQLGHSRSHSRVDLDAMYRRHRSSRGAVPRDIFLRKKEYVLSQSPCRSWQRFSDFSAVAKPFSNPTLKDKVVGDSAWLGAGGIEFVAFIGLRGDEQVRVAKVEARRANAHANPGYEGEHVYMPFSAMNVSKQDVNEFWGRQSWGLQLPDDGALSNCVYCFLKGVGNLEQVRNTMERRKHANVPGFGSMVNTPCDVGWWTSMEQKYGRNLEAERRVRTGADSSSFVGFFGASTGFSYQVLANSGGEGRELSRFSSAVLPCDCTD
jgi:3'-phosphoadenosine 5'-phosphosulfate sulfotransferase (PAPS reductase)/FAD synthetase